MRHRPRQEPLHAHGQCRCCSSGITELPWATRKTRGLVTRPSHNAPAHLTTCPHSDLARTTSVSTTELLARLRGKRQRRRRPIARVAVVAA